MRNIPFSSSAMSSPPPSSHGSSTPGQIYSESDINTRFEYSVSIIRKLEETDQTFPLFERSHTDANEYLRSVMDLQKSMHFFVSTDPTSEKLITAKNLMQVAMNRLQKEFHRILLNYKSSLDHEQISERSSLFREFTDDSEDEIQTEFDLVSNVKTEADRVMRDLKAIADAMISSGYGKECVQIYKAVRKSIIDESLLYLGVEKTSSSQVQKLDWELVEKKIKSWIRAAKIAVPTHFRTEQVLCEHVFSSLPQVAESCFGEITREGATSLFGFPKHVAKYKNLSTEKMFRVLDLHDAVSELWPEIEAVFSYDSVSTVRSQAASCLIRLGDVARNLLAEFQAAIQKENSKSPVASGGIHPLTRYVVNYLIFLSDYSGSLSDILSDVPISTQSPMPESYFSSPVPEDNPASVISERLAWLVLLLLCKLDVKARLYNDMSLSFLFLANNLNYVVSKVRSSNLLLLLGDKWVLNHEQRVNSYASNYVRIGWTRVVDSIPNPTASITLDVAQECFRNFNAAFDEEYRKQSTLAVPDHRMRDEIKVSIAKKLLPLYGEFYETYRMVFHGEGGVVRYTPANLRNYLSGLFDGMRSEMSFGSSIS